MERRRKNLTTPKAKNKNIGREMQRIYLDNAATTQPFSQVVQTMARIQRMYFGNPSSQHHFGREAKIVLEEAREQLAKTVHASTSEIKFTGGGTEANNWALKGSLLGEQLSSKHIIVSAIEHPSVLKCAEFLSQLGTAVTYLSPDSDGIVHARSVKEAIRENTVMVSVQYVNNETGVVQPIEEIGRVCRENEIVFHCDAVQALNKLPIDLQTLPVDLMSFSAHKIHGPKGVGALFIRRGLKLEAILQGGAQEAGRRAGTENVAGIAGFGEALKQSAAQDQTRRIVSLQEYFESGVKHIFPRAVIVGKNVLRSPFISQIAFPGLNNQNLLIQFDLAGIAVSVGSACSSGSIRSSHVLRAMHLPEEIIHSALRFSFSYKTSKNQIKQALERMSKILRNK